MRRRRSLSPNLSVSVKFLGRHVLGEAHAAQPLDALGRGALCDPSAVQLGHGGLEKTDKTQKNKEIQTFKKKKKIKEFYPS
jgi:hypothetical protein